MLKIDGCSNNLYFSCNNENMTTQKPELYKKYTSLH